MSQPTSLELVDWTPMLREILSCAGSHVDADLLVQVISPSIRLYQESPSEERHDRAVDILMAALSLSRSPADSFTESFSLVTLYLRACCLGVNSSVVRGFLSKFGADWDDLKQSGDDRPVLALIGSLEQGLRDRSEEWLAQTELITEKAIARFCPDCDNPWDHEPLFSWREKHPRIDSSEITELHQLLGD